MSEIVYTEGPWKMRVNGCTASIVTESGVGVGLCQQVKKPKTIPNARLISAAPELLEALKRIRDGAG